MSQKITPPRGLAQDSRAFAIWANQLWNAIEAPQIHNNLLNIQGGNATERYHLDATTDSYLSGLTGNVQTQINGKQATITGAATTITSSDLTASRALVSDSSGKVAVSSTVSDTELGYLDGVTSSIQNQIDAKLYVSSTGGNSAWDDSFGQGLGRFAPTGTGNPSLVQVNSGGWGYEFTREVAAINEKQMLCDTQISHGVLAGSDFKFHIHFLLSNQPTAGANVVRFELSYITFDNLNAGAGGGDLSSAGRLTTTSVDVTLTTTWAANSYCIASLISISNVNMTRSSIYQVKIKRKSSHANDTYAGSIYLIGADGHVQLNRRGTAGEFS